MRYRRVFLGEMPRITRNGPKTPREANTETDHDQEFKLSLGFPSRGGDMKASEDSAELTVAIPRGSACRKKAIAPILTNILVLQQIINTLTATPSSKPIKVRTRVPPAVHKVEHATSCMLQYYSTFGGLHHVPLPTDDSPTTHCAVSS